jgi:hypothetical protein
MFELKKWRPEVQAATPSIFVPSTAERPRSEQPVLIHR